MKAHNKIPYPAQKHWLLGNIGEFHKDPLNYIAKKREEVGDIFALKSPFGKFVAITNPQYIKHVLQDNSKNYHKGAAYRTVKPLLGEGLLTSEGEFWRQQRRLAQPAFHKARLEKLFEFMKITIEEFIQNWKNKYKNGDKINISDEMNRLALKVVASSLFQSDVINEMDTVSENLEKAIKRAVERVQRPWILPLSFPTPANLREQKVLNTLKGVIEKIIKERKNSQQFYDDLLDMLLHAQDEETGIQMSEQQLRDEVMTIFMAGHETTANALAYAFFLLNNHPDTNQTLFEEGKNFLATEPLTFASSRNLPYTKLVIQETLRMYPPAWIISRHSLAEDNLGEYTITAHTNIMMNIFVMHRLEQYWEKPNEFIPERFESEKFKTLPKFVYFPFGGGPRLCIGEQFALLEMLLALTLINQEFYFKTVENYNLNPLPLITLRPEKDIYLYLYHR